MLVRAGRLLTRHKEADLFEPEEGDEGTGTADSEDGEKSEEFRDSSSSSLSHGDSWMAGSTVMERVWLVEGLMPSMSASSDFGTPLRMASSAW